MSNLAYYSAVNVTKSTQELHDVVKSIFEQGKLEDYNKDYILDSILNFKANPKLYANRITRKYGIRQQAIMLNFYNK